MITEKQRVEIDGGWPEHMELFMPMPGHPDLAIYARSYRKSEPGVVELTGISQAEFESRHRVCEVCVRQTGECVCAAGPTFKPTIPWPPRSNA